MTVRWLVITTCLVAAAAGSGLAQEPGNDQAPVPRASTMPGQQAAPRRPAPAPTPAVAATGVAPERPRREGQAVNIKVDVTLTDQRGGATPITRTLTVLAADGYTGSIRTSSNVVQVGNVPLNVDASPTLVGDGKIRLAINLQYDWPAPSDNNSPRGTVISTSLHDQLMMILENGKSMIVAQSADPIGERQVMVEVKATILR